MVVTIARPENTSQLRGHLPATDALLVPISIKKQLIRSQTVTSVQKERHRDVEVMRRAIVQRSAQRDGQVRLELALNALKAHTKTQFEV